MIIPVQMLMYSKEANNRKQEIDRQHHTIPNQRANDKHHGNVYNLLFRYGKVRSVRPARTLFLKVKVLSVPVSGKRIVNMARVSTVKGNLKEA